MAVALFNISCLFGAFIPMAVGLAAEWFGLSTVMWVLMIGPVSLLLGLPRRRRAHGR